MSKYRGSYSCAAFHRFIPSRRFFAYATIGLCCAGLDLILFSFILHGVGGHYLFANTAGTVAGIVCSFILNRNFNFRQHDKAVRRFLIFFFVGVLGLLLSSILLYVGVDLLSMQAMPVKLFSIVVVALVQYMLNRDWTFAPTPQLDESADER